MLLIVIFDTLSFPEGEFDEIRNVNKASSVKVKANSATESLDKMQLDKNTSIVWILVISTSSSCDLAMGRVWHSNTWYKFSDILKQHEHALVANVRARALNAKAKAKKTGLTAKAKD